MDITKSMLDKMAAAYKDAKDQHVAEVAVKNNGIHKSCENETVNITDNQFVFSIDVDSEAVSNQRQAGFCWDYSGSNFLRWHIEKKLDLPAGSFQLSQVYIAFWDKLEKSNAFLSRIVEFAGEELDDRKISFLLTYPQQDGGDWDPFCALVDKYGVVPIQAMPDTAPSKNTAEVNALLNRLLRQDALELRDMVRSGKEQRALDDRIAQMVSEVYRILCISFGEPPATFDFEYTDSKKKYHADFGLTPQEFYKKYLADVDLADFQAVANCPDPATPYGKVYGMELGEMMIGGRQIRYLNEDMDTIKGLVIEQLKAGVPVWFACNVEADSDFVSGVLSRDLYDTAQLFGVEWTQDKTDQFLYYQNAMDHAMMIGGVDLVDDKPVRWKIENSWGTKNFGKETGDNGYFIADDSWFDRYVWEVAIDKKHLTADQLAALKGEVTMLPFYSQM